MDHKPDIARRLLAGLIDFLIAGIPALTIPFIGSLLGTAYILTRDALVYETTRNEEYKNKSIGKKLMNLEVTTSESYVTWEVSIKRNILFGIAMFIGVVPILGAILGLIINLVELIRMLTDPRGRRYGDDIAQTRVTQLPAN